ncbi:hypothetical protein J4409_00345 [Candidatus Woesearchaeota archaeon]|nr:hypothetical protein [Candidatus Woesearchaeota archaeon]
MANSYECREGTEMKSYGVAPGLYFCDNLFKTDGGRVLIKECEYRKDIRCVAPLCLKATKLDDGKVRSIAKECGIECFIDT